MLKYFQQSLNLLQTKLVVRANLVLWGLLVSLVATFKTGAALFPDSVNYLHAARSFSESFSFSQFTGEPYVSWPPLYSISIAILHLILPIGYVNAALWINICATIVSSLLLFEILSQNRTSILQICVAGLFSVSMWPLFQLTSEIVSEPLFICLTLAGFYALFIKEKWTIALVFISLAMLQRYIGIVAWISLVVWGLYQYKKRKKWILYSFISGIPIGLWLFKNFLVSHSLTGIRSDSFINLYPNFLLGIDVVSKWFLPHFFPFFIRLIVFCIVALFVILFLYRNKSSFLARFSFVFASLYFISIWLISTSGASEALSFRLLAPMYPFVLISIFQIGFDSSLMKHNFKSNIMIAIFLIIGIYQTLFLARITVDKFTNGAGGFSRLEWTNSETLRWFNSQTFQNHNVVSNAADAIYALTEKRIKLSPFWYDEQHIDSLLPSGAILIWFNKMNRKTTIPLDSLSNKINLNKIYSFSDGEVLKRR